MIHTGLVGNTERKEILEDLTTRGLFQDSTDQTALKERLNEGPITLYCGFDPTADSLHLGHLVPLLTLRRFQDAGHRPIALAGGATGMVGDPSGRSEERNLLDSETLNHNLSCIKKQLESFLDFDCGDNSSELVNNYDWLKDFSFLDFIGFGGLVFLRFYRVFMVFSLASRIFLSFFAAARLIDKHHPTPELGD